MTSAPERTRRDDMREKWALHSMSWGADECVTEPARVAFTVR